MIKKMISGMYIKTINNEYINSDVIEGVCIRSNAIVEIITNSKDAYVFAEFTDKNIKQEGRAKAQTALTQLIRLLNHANRKISFLVNSSHTAAIKYSEISVVRHENEKIDCRGVVTTRTIIIGKSGFPYIFEADKKNADHIFEKLIGYEKIFSVKNIQKTLDKTFEKVDQS